MFTHTRVYFFILFLSLDNFSLLFYNKNMKNQVCIQPIGYIQTDFKEKFGIPRQSGRATALQAQIIFHSPYRNPDMLRGIENFSHLWVLFDFSATRANGFSATVRPPRLGGNTRVGVFATRSPFRPNHIGLSCVKLEGVEHTAEYGDTLIVSGADLLDGTPIFDIKPYVPHADCIPTATGGYADENADHSIEVQFPPALLERIPMEKRDGLLQCLADDPIPAYQRQPDRIYGMAFANFQIKFTVQDDVLTVIEVE